MDSNIESVEFLKSDGATKRLIHSLARIFISKFLTIFPFCYHYSCLATFATYEKALDSIKALNDKVGAANGLILAKENLEMKYHEAWISGILKTK